VLNVLARLTEGMPAVRELSQQPSVTSVPCQALGVSSLRNSRTSSPARVSQNSNTIAWVGLALVVQYDQM
jgi:hypothetical protein